MTLVIRSDRSMLGEAADVRLLAVEHTAPRRNEATPRTPVSLCLVIDRSGSMGADKMASLCAPRVKRSTPSTTATT